MNTRSTQNRIKPVGRLHSVIWLIAGVISVLLSAACLVITIASVPSSFRGATSAGQVAKDMLELLFFLGVAAVFGFGGYWLINSGRGSSSAKSVFERSNRLTEGVVVRRWVRRVEGSGPYDDDTESWHATIRFVADSGPVTLRAGISKKLYDEISPDQPIKVKYATSDPCIALLEGEFRT